MRAVAFDGRVKGISTTAGNWLGKSTWCIALVASICLSGCGYENVPAPGSGPVTPSTGPPSGGKKPDSSAGKESWDPTRNAYVATSDPLNEPVEKVAYLPQNWTAEQSVQFYFTDQGSQLMPYEWFLALEQPDSTKTFRDNQNLLKYRCLPQNPGPLNPEGLPVGFVAGKGNKDRWLGLTCAACHTSEIRDEKSKVSYRIDGAPTHADVQALLTDLVRSLQETQKDGAKFDRFSAKVLGSQHDPASVAELKNRLELLIKIRTGYNLRNFPGFETEVKLPVLPAPSRYGILDAVDAITNEVYWHAVVAPDLDNPSVVAKPANAQVSYPFLWDAPQSDFVEWLGVAKGGGPLDIFSLSRNVGEVLGVFGNFEFPVRPELINTGYRSSVEFMALRNLEDELKSLWSPLWPEDVWKIDHSAASKGAEIYKAKLEGGKSCLDCHALIDRKDPNRTIKSVIDDVDTDPQAWLNFFGPTRPSGRLQGVNINLVPFTAKMPAQADANSMLSHAVIGVILGGYKEAPRDQLENVTFNPHLQELTRDLKVPAKYKTRPLNGIWATAPYLHNGSVPNLDALLRKAADRPKSFSIGVRTFDPDKVGFKDLPGFPKFEVMTPADQVVVGHSNQGHEYGTNLGEDERKQLIEYLKTL